jgi:methylmalonyl-CoA/ethylmalonyl-CoA epimerase
MFNGLDHLAIIVADTDEALKIWRDKVGLPVLYSEIIQNGTLRMTHLDLGNTQLQLVQPLTADHPLNAWLKEHGSGLHHFCLKVDDVSAAYDKIGELGLPPAGPPPHQGTQGKRATFIDPAATGGIRVELTGK